jgi:hypothetical protein
VSNFWREKGNPGERHCTAGCNILSNGDNMEYLITSTLVSMMALYTLIIVGCSKQPEW